jgi:hypothetical protein
MTVRWPAKRGDVGAAAAEVNDLSAAVTWANIPIANVPTGTSGTTVALGDHLHTGVYGTAADVTANTAKVTNATHTGDVTGSTALTIAAGAVDIAMLSASGTADATTFLRGDNTWATPAGGGSTSPKLILPFHANTSGNSALTNQANTEQFIVNNSRNICQCDLTDFTQYRLCARVVTGSASANSPRLYAQYHTSFTTTVATYSDLGSGGEVALSLTTAGAIKTAWTTIAAGALADVFLTVMQHGGDATADPAIAHVQIQFR